MFTRLFLWVLHIKMRLITDELRDTTNDIEDAEIAAAYDLAADLRRQRYALHCEQLRTRQRIKSLSQEGRA
jgi:hypothetical protein